MFTIFSHFYEFDPFLALLSYFYDCEPFEDFEAFLRVRPIFAILSNINLQVEPIFYLFKPFVRLRPILTILSRIYGSRPGLPLSAVFTTATHFYRFEPYIQVQAIFTILSHLYECQPFLPFLRYF